MTTPNSEVPFVFSVDLDGVVFDYEQAMRLFVSQTRGIDPSELPVMTSWSFANSGWPFETDDEFLETHAQAVVEGGLFLTMRPYPQVSEALWRLSDAGIHIRITTARLTKNGTHAAAIADTVRSLDNHNIPFRDLLFTKFKDHALSGVAADAPARVLHIDDSPSQLAALQAAGVPTIVMDQPYNQDVPGPRARSWAEVEQLVCERAGVAAPAA